jgi:hypothetical protein
MGTLPPHPSLLSSTPLQISPASLHQWEVSLCRLVSRHSQPLLTPYHRCQWEIITLTHLTHLHLHLLLYRHPLLLLLMYQHLLLHYLQQTFHPVAALAHTNQYR